MLKDSLYVMDCCRMTRDPEMSSLTTKDGRHVNRALVHVATEDGYTDRNGQYQEHTSFFTITFWNDKKHNKMNADNIVKLGQKGRELEITVTGGDNSYTDKNGQTHWVKNFQGTDFRFLDATPKQNSNQTANTDNNYAQNSYTQANPQPKTTNNLSTDEKLAQAQKTIMDKSKQIQAEKAKKINNQKPDKNSDVFDNDILTNFN